MFAVGEPSADNFIIVVASDTGNDGSITEGAELGKAYNGMAKTLEQAIEASTGTGCTVTRRHLSGNGFASGLTLYSDESQNDD
jgi:hypothetical protein